MPPVAVFDALLVFVLLFVCDCVWIHFLLLFAWCAVCAFFCLFLCVAVVRVCVCVCVALRLFVSVFVSF